MFRMLIYPSSGACDLFVELFYGLYCSGSMCVGVTLWFGWSGVVSVCRLKHCVQYNPWNNSTNKTQVSEDGCINIRNMLSIKWRNNKASDIKLVSLYSTIKMVHGPINIRFVIAVRFCVRQHGINRFLLGEYSLNLVCFENLLTKFKFR